MDPQSEDPTWAAPQVTTSVSACPCPDSAPPLVTKVSYPSGSLAETSTVVSVLADPRPDAKAGLLVFTEQTPFHPVDPQWPDQPDDYGWLELAGHRRQVHRTLTAASSPGGPTAVDDQIAVRRDDPDVVFRVAHLVDDFAGAADTLGAPVQLLVDGARRHALSAAHTGCHLVAYAFNEATDELWRKDAPRNSRGHRDFDRAALLTTRHDLTGSVDRYRLGKSLHRRGFGRDAVIDRLDEMVTRTNDTLRGWLSSDAAVHVLTDGPLLTSRREWVCELPCGTARMPCGGTHVRRLGEIDRIHVTATLTKDDSELTLTAHTVTRLAEPPAGT